MNRLRNYLPLPTVLLSGAVMMGAPAQARAAFQIRVTEVDSTNHVIGTSLTSGVQANGNGTLQIFNTATTDFSIVATSNIVTTGGFTTSHSETMNITYTGATVGATGPKLLIEFIGDAYGAPPTSTALIINNASPSTSGLVVNSVVQSSSVVNGNQVGSGIAAAPSVGSAYTGYFTSGLLGTTTSSGMVGSSTSGVLMPNPGVGPAFGLTTPFTFYQVYTYSNFGTTGEASALSAGSSVTNTPAPVGLVLALTGLPALGAFGWMRRRKAGPAA